MNSKLEFSEDAFPEDDIDASGSMSTLSGVTMSDCVTSMSDGQDEQDLLYYKSTGTKYLHIFNHETFEASRYFGDEAPPSRPGTAEDVNRLTAVFQNLDYKVAVHNNLDHNKIMKEILAISKQDHKDTAYVCFAFLTHGNKGGKLYAADRIYEFQDVTSPLVNGHSSLVGIPKIYFVQACRGKGSDGGRRLQMDGGRAAITLPSHADFFTLNSSVEEYVSYRNKNGSFMIQELCNVVEEYHADLDILHISTVVNKRVAYEYSAYAPKNLQVHNKKQMPEVRHTLTKLFKF